MKKPIIIFGSARSNGNTFEAIKVVTSKVDSTVIDLANYKIGDYDYNHQNKADDFSFIIEQVLKHETIILATPVYWYTMSAIMKRFVDRLTDLLELEKYPKEVLRNKNLAIISSYGAPEGKNGFEEIFINTARYLGMNYLGCYFHYSGDDLEIRALNAGLADNFIGNLVPG